MPAPSVPLWYYLLAALCIFNALTPSFRIPGGVPPARRAGMRFGMTIRFVSLSVAATGLFLHWAWAMPPGALVLAMSLPATAKRAAIGVAEGRRPALRGTAGPAPDEPLVLAPIDGALGLVIASVMRGLPAVLLMIAMLRMAG